MAAGGAVTSCGDVPGCSPCETGVGVGAAARMMRFFLSGLGRDSSTVEPKGLFWDPGGATTMFLLAT